MSIKFFACGDLVNYTSNKNFIDNNLKNIIKKCEISMCNFEAPIETRNMQPIKKAGTHIYQSKYSIEYISNSGFNFVSLANNHIYDYGQNALDDTIKELIKYNINFIGGGLNFKQAYQPKIVIINNLKIGILAACENEFGCLYEKEEYRGGYAWLFNDKIEDTVRKIKAEVDFVVFAAHAGVECIKIPIKEIRNRYKRLCDAGVDVIVGHHPHVPQSYEKYKKSLIFYSLGNFYFDTASFKDKSDDSYSIVLEFEKGKEIKFDIIYHKMKDGKTCVVSKKNVNFDIDYLNSLLENDYEKLNNKISLELFYKYYYNYYKIALGVLPENSTFLQKIKHIVEKLFLKKRNSNKMNLMLLHNIRIDSHRFIVQRALSLISEEKYKEINEKSDFF